VPRPQLLLPTKGTCLLQGILFVAVTQSSRTTRRRVPCTARAPVQQIHPWLPTARCIRLRLHRTQRRPAQQTLAALPPQEQTDSTYSCELSDREGCSNPLRDAGARGFAGLDTTLLHQHDAHTCSVGSLTSQATNWRSTMSGCHRLRSRSSSRTAGALAGVSRACGRAARCDLWMQPAATRADRIGTKHVIESSHQRR